MAKVMLTFDAVQAPTLQTVKARFGLSDDEIDATFGVMEIDPESHSYRIRVEDFAAARIRGASGNVLSGSFPSPKLTAFDPAESAPKPKG